MTRLRRVAPLKAIRTLAAGALAAALVITDVPVVHVAPIVEFRLVPHYLSAPATLRLTIVVDPNAENRTLRVEMDGDVEFRSSDVTLEGDKEKRHHEITFVNIPAGSYDLRAS